MNGLDLFSGIGGIAYGLQRYVRPVAYCEIDNYCQKVLISRMFAGDLPKAPIWDDVKTLPFGDFKGRVDIITGGFPCQDISLAGRRKGLEGERSGLFFEIMRAVDAIRPKLLFLENVPGITSKGLGEVAGEITFRGYDSRWCSLSAEEVGAPHKRNRWWLLARRTDADSEPKRPSERMEQERIGKCSFSGDFRGSVSDTHGTWELQQKGIEFEFGRRSSDVCEERSRSGPLYRGWWKSEPDVGRVANGIPSRMDRLKGLGNAVVPLQALMAFEFLAGINNGT